MIELASRKKSKIHLDEYNYLHDLKIRKTLVQLPPIAIELIDEILYSKKTMSIWKLAQNVGTISEEILPILEELEKLELLTISDTEITTHKEAKKYFEYEILRFTDEFKPDLSFFQALLKRLPIHILPNWYQIPKSSNHIFQSIVEKYLHTPLLYQRHLSEVKADPTLAAIIEELSDGAKPHVATTELKEKLSISDDEMAESILHLEYNFICFAQYLYKDGKWEEYLLPLYEWHQFLSFKEKMSKIPTDEIKEKDQRPFAFIEDLSAFLQNELFPKEESYVAELKEIAENLHFLDEAGKRLPTADEWLALPTEEKSLYLFQHRHSIFPSGATERALCEAEKSVRCAIGKGWVIFDHFLSIAEIALDQSTKIALQNKGRLYRYQFPEYSDAQKKFIHQAIFGNLYRLGMVSVGTWEGKDCFTVTPFGEKFFAL